MVAYRHLGSSGLKITEITYGNWLTHGSQVESDTAIECVHTALDLGITSFDTADVYANTAAVQGVVKDPAGLFYCSPEKLAELGVKTCMRHEVTEVDLTGKKLRVRDLESGKDFEDTFDKLIVTSGSWPVEPPIENVKLENVLLCKNYAHAMEIVKRCGSARSVAVIGAGYIGTELVEAFETQGKSVTFIDQMAQVLPRYLDPDVIDVIEKIGRAHV